MNKITYQWDEEKNNILKKSDRKISFEDVVFALKNERLLDVIPSPTHGNQDCLVLNINDYVYIVPFVTDGNEVFLKTIYSMEELELFKTLEDDIDNGKCTPLSQKELEGKKAFFKQVAINTIEKKTRKKSLNIRLFEEDRERIKVIALEQGIPYQTLISSVIHKLALKQIKG